MRAGEVTQVLEIASSANCWEKLFRNFQSDHFYPSKRLRGLSCSAQQRDPRCGRELKPRMGLCKNSRRLAMEKREGTGEGPELRRATWARQWGWQGWKWWFFCYS